MPDKSMIEYQDKLQSQALLLEFISRFQPEVLPLAMTQVSNLNESLKSLIYGK